MHGVNVLLDLLVRLAYQIYELDFFPLCYCQILLLLDVVLKDQADISHNLELFWEVEVRVSQEAEDLRENCKCLWYPDFVQELL
jgi:hypothetical protein